MERETGPWQGGLAEALGALWPASRFIPIDEWEIGQPDVAQPSVDQRLAAAPVIREPVLRIAAPLDGVIELTAHFGSPRSGRACWVAGRFRLHEAATVRVHLGADWWMQWWLDGRPVADTLGRGNRSPVLGRATRAEAALAAGEHLLVGRIISGNGGWAAAVEVEQLPPMQPTGEDFHIECRRRFAVADTTVLRSLTCCGGNLERLRLNGRAIPFPLAEMRYRQVPGLPVEMITAGDNQLEIAYSETESRQAAEVGGLRLFAASGDCRRLKPDGQVWAVPAGAEGVQSGPVIVDVTGDSCDVTCRTNSRVPAVLRIGRRRLVSPAGLHHHWHIDGLEPGSVTPFAVRAGDGVNERTGRVRTWSGVDPLRLIICGDAGPLPRTWAATAARIGLEQPHAAAFVGDLVNAGREDECWDREFFTPAAELLAAVPLFSVLGNHDQDSALYHRLMTPPGRGRHWARRLGPLLLVGIDGAADWSEGSAAELWLVGELAGTDAPFVFVLNHYPAWSSGPHLRQDESGEVVEPPCRASRRSVLPLLIRHRVTAVFSGHDHFYERSELPEGLTCIVSGGAGAYLYDKGALDGQNPHRRVFQSSHHYCVLDATESNCRMTVKALDGRTLDERQWLPRRSAG